MCVGCTGRILRIHAHTDAHPHILAVLAFRCMHSNMCGAAHATALESRIAVAHPNRGAGKQSAMYKHFYESLGTYRVLRGIMLLCVVYFFFFLPE